MKKLTYLSLVLFFAAFLWGCGENIEVVESGTYQGNIAEVVPEEEEIYVNLDNGKKIELYFKENTKLMRDTAEVAFAELKKGGRVEVTVEKVGQRLEPQTVRILE